MLQTLTQLLKYDPESPMIFSSGIFWALFLLFIPIFALVRDRKWQMTTFVVAFSLFFYYKCSGLFFLMLVCTSLIDWTLSRCMAKTDRRWLRRLYATLSLLCSLGILGYFKYANFFLWNWSQMVEGNFQPLDIVLPVGISFYTFQSVSYIIDVYKRKVEPTSNWLDYAFFLTFFPALVAGPIVRADYFLPQIKNSTHATKQQMYAGLWLIIIGVVKKSIIADYIAQYNDLVFDNPGAYSGFETIMGILGYTMQIYCDFSGYSDMAIGIALIMGFHLAKNFNFPYKSKNLSEFWHRWHISLSTWLRDYVYIPMGGNRKGAFRTYLNNFLTMLIGGLWHGAAWKFIIWGGVHGLGLCLHKAFKPLLDRIPNWWPIKAISWLFTMACVMVLWVYFRAASIHDAFALFSSIFYDFDLRAIMPFLIARRVWVAMMAFIILTHALPERWWEKAGDIFVKSPWICKLVVLLVVVQTVIEFRSADVAPFIYFQF